MAKTAIIIPARYESRRLPGKCLKRIGSKTVIQHVYSRALMIQNVDMVLVATDSASIKTNIEDIGGMAMLTKGLHANGTSRVAEIAHILPDHDFIINIQGDELFIQPQAVESLINLLKSGTTSIVSLMAVSNDMQMLSDHNVVKVVTDSKKKALYFSRSCIPFSTDEVSRTFFTHIGVYGYQRETLLKLVELPTGHLEKSENLEQLRWLEHGYDIQMLEVSSKVPNINTERDLALAQEYLSRTLS